MRLGPLDTTAVLFGDVRAGRAAARSGVPELKFGGAVPITELLLSRLRD